MGIKQTAEFLRETYGKFDHAYDLTFSKHVSDLVSVYLGTSENAKVKLRIGKGTYPIKVISMDYEYISIDNRIVTFNYLNDMSAKFIINSFEDFWDYLDSLGDHDEEFKSDRDSSVGW